MSFVDIMSLCQMIFVILGLSILSFAGIQVIIHERKEHKIKMEIFEKELKRNKNEFDNELLEMEVEVDD